MNDVKGGHGLSSGVLSVGHGVSDDVLKDLEDTTGLLVDALDVVTKDPLDFALFWGNSNSKLSTTVAL